VRKSINNIRTTNNILDNIEIIDIIFDNKDKKVNKNYTIKNNNIIIN